MGGGFMLDKIFGASWGTSLLGYSMAVLIEADTFVKAGGFPDTAEGRLTAILGIMVGVFGRVTKQSNVSHSERPKEPISVEDAPKRLG
jgi:hypothetical protein